GSKSLVLFFMAQKEVRLGSLFFIFAFLIPLFRIFYFFLILSYFPFPFLVVLSSALVR
uniref:Uncharacterized protein n=1 Tax=Oryza brachyantha TaxID=4533 RepID=J3LF52_ORYBR